MISSARLGFQLPVHFETSRLFVFSPTSTSFPGSSAHLADALLSVLGNRDFLKRKISEVLTFSQEVMARWSMQQMSTRGTALGCEGGEDSGEEMNKSESH